MKKVYVKFGEPLDGDDHIYVYEGLLEDKMIKLTLPSLSYMSCQNVAKDMELPAFLVEGKYMGQSNSGQPALTDYKIISKLTFDQYKECFIYDGDIKEKEEKTVQPSNEELPAYKDSDPGWFRFMCNVGYLITTGTFGPSKGNSKKGAASGGDLHTFTKK